MNPFIELVLSSFYVLLAAAWSAFCLWLGFRMAKSMAVPVQEKPLKVDKKAHETVEIDKLADDPWDEAMIDEEPGARITGDVQ